MTVKVPYGDGQVETKIPSSHRVMVLEPKRGKGIGSVAEELRKADIESLLRPFRRVTLIVNDATRPTPTAEILKGLRPALAQKEVKILVGTGAHRKPVEKEFQRLLGGLYEEFRPVTFAHDWRDERLLAKVGTTTRGTPVVLNKRALEAEAVLAISSVEPHWFAGYTGGRKSLLPAIAGEQSILANHKLVLKGESDSLKLAGNPVHEDMDEAMDLLSTAKRAVILGGVELHRYGLMTEFYRLVEASRLPVATTLLGKTVISEHHPQAIGVYEGGISRKEIRDIVENADVLLCLGAWMSDINMGVYTGRLEGRRMILANSGRLKISQHVYEQVWIGDVVTGLADRMPKGGLSHPPFMSFAELSDTGFVAEKGRPITVDRIMSGSTRISARTRPSSRKRETRFSLPPILSCITTSASSVRLSISRSGTLCRRLSAQRSPIPGGGPWPSLATVPSR